MPTISGVVIPRLSWIESSLERTMHLKLPRELENEKSQQNGFIFIVFRQNVFSKSFVFFNQF